MLMSTSWVFTTIFYQFCWLLCGPCDQVFQCIGREHPPFANETRDFGAWTLDDAEMKEKTHKTQKQLCKKSSRSGYPFTKGTGIHRFLSFRPFTIVFVTLEHRYRYARGGFREHIELFLLWFSFNITTDFHGLAKKQHTASAKILPESSTSFESFAWTTMAASLFTIQHRTMWKVPKHHFPFVV